MQTLQQSIAQDDVDRIISEATMIPNNLENGLTPLQYAAQHNSVNAIRLFLFQARMLNKQGKTALFLAAQANSLEAVQLLAQHESRLLVNGVSALEIAALKGNLEVVKIMLEYEPERAKMAMFRARAKKQLETANWIKQWMMEQGSQSGYNVSSILTAQVLDTRTNGPRTVGQSTLSPAKSGGQNSPAKTGTPKGGIISGIFSDEDSLEVAELAQSVVQTKPLDNQQVRSATMPTLCCAAYDDPSDLLQQRIDQLQADFTACKQDYQKAVETCTQYRNLSLQQSKQLEESKKQLSCLKIELSAFHKRFDAQQAEIGKCAAENEEMAAQLQQCRQQLIYKQNQLQYQADEAAKRITQIQKDYESRISELERVNADSQQKVEALKRCEELLDQQIHECDVWKERCAKAETQSDASLDEINKLQAECAEQRVILGQAAAQDELAQQEIRELKLLIQNEDVKYLMEQLERKAEEVFVPTIRKLKDKMGV